MSIYPHANEEDVQELLASREEAALLRSEVEQLQLAIAERDELLETLNATDAIEDVDDQLLSRLEDLLAELEQSDDRIATLERSLQAADEALRASRDEREQIERWVHDIEDRVGEREAEWQATVEALQHRLREEHVPLDELAAPDRSANQVETPTVPETYAPPDQHSSEAVESMREELEIAERRCRALEESLRMKDDEMSQSSVDSAQLREERLAIAQERAALARDRAELASSSLHHDDNHPGNSEIDVRVREFRKHLREIHDEEERQREEASLSARLARLWAKLDGRSAGNY